MLRKKLRTTTAIIATIGMVSTATIGNTSYASDKQALGSLLGAAGGALIGSKIGKGKGQLAAVAVGTLLGAGVGGTLTSDNAYAHKPIKRRPTYHHNPGYSDYGVYNSYYQHSYTPSYYVPVAQPQPQIMSVSQTMTSAQGPIHLQPQNVQAQPAAPYCREFIMQNVSIAGKTQESYGTACMQPDGSWQIQP